MNNLGQEIKVKAPFAPNESSFEHFSLLDESLEALFAYNLLKLNFRWIMRQGNIMIQQSRV